jgi:signal peptidase I
MRFQYKRKILCTLAVLVGLLVPASALAAAAPATMPAASPPIGSAGPSSTMPPGGGSSSCAGDSPNYSALYQMSEDTYDVYAKLGQADQIAPATVWFQGFSATDCKLIGTVTVNGTTWTKLGVTSSHGKDGFGTFTLASSVINSLPGANRPTVMLVSQTKPVCQPTTDCFVNIGSHQASLRASGTLLNEDSLHVVTAKDPAQDKVTRVDYYVDSSFVYYTENLQPFNMHYVNSGKHTLETVINYNSKQQALIVEKVNRPYYDDLTYYLFIFFHEQKPLLVITGSLLLIVVVFELVIFVIRTVHHRRVWKSTHVNSIQADAVPVSADQAASMKAQAPDKPREFHGEMITRIVWLFGGLIISVALVAILNSWVAQLYQVDGPSMNSTLYTGDRLLVDRVGKTFAAATHKKYIPKRNEVIVFVKETNVLFAAPGASDAPTFVVKRVMGLPGERVTVNNGNIVVYNADHPEGIKPDVGKWWTPLQHHETSDSIDITLGPDEIFVCGDNRPESVDSRYYGPVKLNEIIGRAHLRVYPFGKIRGL